MYNYSLHEPINEALKRKGIDRAGDSSFYARLMANAADMADLYFALYKDHARGSFYFGELIDTIIEAHLSRPDSFRQMDDQKLKQGLWFLSNKLAGMSLYVDRWCGQLKSVPDTLAYLKGLGINLVHLMPIFQSPPAESDGGYAVSDFRKVDPRFGSLDDLKILRKQMIGEGMYLMLDIVLNHTSRRHAWAEKAKQGDSRFQDFFYMFVDRTLPDLFDAGMPDIFPESSPGNFTYVEELNKWVMTVFHQYQWDLNFRNPAVLVAMVDTIFFYANLGVDILRIDAPAFIWKEAGTTSQNLPQAHALLRLIRQCVQVAAPGMALLGEAIVAPSAIMEYFGTGNFAAKECDLAYNAAQMALQWDALATGDTRVMLAAQSELSRKPLGTSWITYTRGHDDIGLGYEDYMIREAGFQPFAHRKFLTDYYSGRYPAGDATGALFSFNPKTQDARISGSLASLCGLEKALLDGDLEKCERAIQKILLMQAQSFFIGGIPMLFYGDEAGYTNDYTYLSDPGKSYDNRWMHRPIIEWGKNARTAEKGTIEQQIFSGTQKLLAIRRKLNVLSDHKNIEWLPSFNPQIAGFVRSEDDRPLYCLFNFSGRAADLTWWAFKEKGTRPFVRLYDHWSEKTFVTGPDREHLHIPSYSFVIAEEIA